MGKTFWKCANEDCSDDHIYRFKGLCRTCTTYVDGKPTEPVPRIRVLQSGTPYVCLLYTSPSPRDRQKSRMPSSA